MQGIQPCVYVKYVFQTYIQPYRNKYRNKSDKSYPKIFYLLRLEDMKLYLFFNGEIFTIMKLYLKDDRRSF